MIIENKWSAQEISKKITRDLGISEDRLHERVDELWRIVVEEQRKGNIIVVANQSRRFLIGLSESAIPYDIVNDWERKLWYFDALKEWEYGSTEICSYSEKHQINSLGLRDKLFGRENDI